MSTLKILFALWFFLMVWWFLPPHCALQSAHSDEKGAHKKIELLSGLDPNNFLERNEIEWTPWAHGQMLIAYCDNGPFFIEIFKTCPDDHLFIALYDIVMSGPTITEADVQNPKNKYPFAIQFRGYAADKDADGHSWGYILKKYPNAYIKVMKLGMGGFKEFRWKYLAIDPCEDGINGNEIPYSGPYKSPDCF